MHNDLGTFVELFLNEPVTPMGPPTNVWEFVDLPAFRAPKIEFWVAIKKPGLPACMALAAVVHSAF